MDGYIYLTFNEEYSIIISGKRIDKNEIVFNSKPSFFDAIRFSDSSPPQDGNLPFQYIPITSTSNMTFHFHDPLLNKRIKFTIDHNKLIIKDTDNILTPDAVHSLFNYFLIKKGKKMLFLTDVPNNKIIKREKDKFLSNNDERIRNQD
jgi:hypothetical protein